MSTCQSSKFKNGLKILFNREPYLVETAVFVKPGKGKAFVRVKLKSLITGQLIDKTFKSTDSFDLANIIDVSVIFLYRDDVLYHFMNIKNFEQLSLHKSNLYSCIQWLLEGEKYSATQWNNKLISIIPNNFICLKVVDVEPFIKGDSINSGSKFVKLNTGMILKVPFFIQVNDLLKINTRSGEYVSRVKKY